MSPIPRTRPWPAAVARLYARDVLYGSASRTPAAAARVGDAAAGTPETPEKAATAECAFIAVDPVGLPRPVLEPSAKACDDPASADSGDETWTPPT